MTGVTAQRPTVELRDQQAHQLRTEIAALCEEMYRTLADMQEAEARHHYKQERRTRLTMYHEQLSALVGVEAADSALEEINDRALREQVAVVRNSERPERCRTLWILVCSIKNSDVHEAVPLYAANAEDAEQQAQQWLNATPRSLHRLDMRAYPSGFVMGRRRLDGMII
ncbi:MAG TPA: hypothetical protein VKU38_17215 [Ktedonobacteraceae bacterium]|nr:hypothetical protein [Ktedonobacteraceae bacterium]